MAVELEVVGRHAMLFDDDATLEFVNSKDALIEWNSLFIDRFDVRNLITTPPPVSFRNLPTSYYRVGSSDLVPDDDSDLFPDLYSERFRDLDSSCVVVDDDHNDDAPEVEPTNAGGYNCVPFSYGISSDATDQKDSDTGLNASSFLPPFPVPENLLQHLPSTEKVHQIIARTAMFVGEHGGQSEIVLRVKQGDNPTFGFLMPHHHLHPYFRYLVDHQEFLKTDNDNKSQEEKMNEVQATGALSLLGSVYGSGEDEDGTAETERGSEHKVSGGTPSAADIPKSDQSEQTSSAGNGPHKDETVSIHPQVSKVKASINSKHGRVSSTKIDGNISSSISSSSEKTKATSLFPLSHVETSVVDPPSETKKLIDRIVEIILKNGKDFEAVLIEQDKKRGKFPFLLPSNQYNPYYLRVLKKAQESRISGKTFPGKDGSSWQEMDKNAAHKMKENELTSLEESDDLDLDYGKKEKFKMVIPKAKKDSQDQPSKESQPQCGVTVDATAAAAILQAATRGIRNPNLTIFSKTSHRSTVEGESSSGLALKENGDHSHNDINIAKIAAQAVGSQPNSSDERLLRQQKLKAERLRRAKMFAAMIKSGAAPLGTEPPRGSSVEPVGSGNSGLATENFIEKAKGREESCPPMEAGVSNEVMKSVQDLSNDENDKKLSKRRHYRSRIRADGEGGSEENGEDSAEDEDKRKSMKRRKSRHSSRHHRDRSKDRHKHRRRRSSKSKESRHRQKSDSSSAEEHKHRKRRHRYEGSSEEEKEQLKRRHRRDNSVKEEKEHHKRRHRLDDSSEEDSKHRKRRHEQDDSSDEHHKRRRSLDGSSEEHHKRRRSLDSSSEEHHKRRRSLDGSSEEESKVRKRRHRQEGSSEEETKHHKRRHHESHRKDRHRERSRKNDKSHPNEGELEEGEIRTRSSDQSLSAIGDDASQEVSVDASKSPPHEIKRSSLPPTETTEVPDDLRAKIRAMLLATM